MKNATLEIQKQLGGALAILDNEGELTAALGTIHAEFDADSAGDICVEALAKVERNGPSEALLFVDLWAHPAEQGHVAECRLENWTEELSRLREATPAFRETRPAPSQAYARFLRTLGKQAPVARKSNPGKVSSDGQPIAGAIAGL